MPPPAVLLATLGVLALPALAEERPTPRPDAPPPAAERPVPRADGTEPGGGTAEIRTETGVAPEEEPADAVPLHPRPRPGGVAIGPRGAVCGRPGIRGERLTPLREEGGCGIARPVRVRSVGGVVLEPAAVLDCRTAEALETWVEDAAQPAFGEGDDALARLGVAASYVCRGINGATDGDLSEHAAGRAIDIAWFERADGATITVLEGWGDPREGGLLRRVHRAACGIFGTALGPDSDAWHADHFHYDVAERRRPFCPG